MSSLVIVYFVVLLLAWNNRPLKNHGVIFLVCLLFASRPMGVPDTINYYDIFHYSMDDIMMQYEYGYRYLNYICHDILKMDFNSYLFIISLFMLEGWYYCTKRLLPQAHYGVLFLLFFSFYGIYYDGIVIRNALGIVICYIGFLLLEKPYKYKYILYYLFVILAFLMHVGTVLFALVPFLRKPLKKRTLIIWSLINISLVVFVRIDFIHGILDRLFAFEELSRLSNFQNDENVAEQRISLFFILNYILSVFVIFLRDKVHPPRLDLYNFFLNIFIYGVFLNCLTSSINAGSRAGDQFIYFSSIPVYLACYESTLFNKNTGRLVMYILSGLYFFALTHYFPNILNY